MATTTPTVLIESPRKFGNSIENNQVSPNKKRPRDDGDLVKELASVRKERDALKVALAKAEQEIQALKEQYEPSEEAVQESVNNLRGTLASQVSRAIVWRPSCKGNGARLSVSMPNVSRAEYKGLIGEDRFAQMTKGKKAEKKVFTLAAKTEEDVRSILGCVPGTSVRYGGYLSISMEGQGLRFVYDTSTRKLTVSGKYVL